VKIFGALLAFLLSVVALEQFASAYIFPPTVSQLDVPRYMGKWYEVESTKPFFQNGCVCNTAEYKLLEDGTVSVKNSCHLETPTGPLRVVEAIARPTSEPGKLCVDFGGVRLPIANYWVIDLAPDYSYAVVSTLLRNPVWILSRQTGRIRVQHVETF
jgi:apolipoprotein D and lipocalin family protein